jgi:uncharacterized protein with HEPN domain
VNDRITRWVGDLENTLEEASRLAARGRAAYDSDPAVPLAFEALCTRVGELAKRLIAVDAERFSAAIWSQAARNRDFVVHHYNRVDRELLWRTVTVSFVELRAELR